MKGNPYRNLAADIILTAIKDILPPTHPLRKGHNGTMIPIRSHSTKSTEPKCKRIRNHNSAVFFFTHNIHAIYAELLRLDPEIIRKTALKKAT